MRIDRSGVVVVPALACTLLCGAAAHVRADGTLLATGQKVTPTAATGARFLELNPGLKNTTPLLPGQPDPSQFIAGQEKTTVLSPDGTTLLVLTSGFNRLADADGHGVPDYSNEYVFVFDVTHRDPQVRQVLQLPNTFDGVAFAPDGKTFYVSGGVDNNVHVFTRGSGGFSEDASPIALNAAAVFPNGAGPQAAGLAVNADGSRLVVANYESDSISIIDTKAKSVVTSFDLRPGKIDASRAGVPGGEFPYWVSIKGNSTAFVSSVRDREIDVVDFAAAPKLVGRIALRGNPNRMLMNRSQTRLYVTSDNSDTVDIIDTAALRVIGSVNTTAPASRFTGRMPQGSSPNSMALTPDERTLFVTNGGANSVAVIALHGHGEADVEGLIPTGWYPNSVSVGRDGQTLYVANGKSKEGPNAKNCTQVSDDTHPAGYLAPNCSTSTDWNGAQNQYVLQKSKGGLLVLPTPRAADLQRLTEKVAENDGFRLGLSADDRRVMEGLRQRIRHVIYVVKENRTYDQVLGDLGRGNGDPSIAQFPQATTPNFHALASGFVDLDNFSCSGDVSMDGWQWSTAARTSDANEKAYIVNYSGRGLSYDSEGDARNSISVWHDTIAARQRIDPSIPADVDLLPGPRNEVEVDGPSGQLGAGYLWDAVLRAGKSLRNYGMFVDVPSGTPLVADPRTSNIQVAEPSNAAIDPYTDKFYRGWDTCLPDFYRVQEWATEFDQYAAQSAASGKDGLPNLSLVRLPQDHMGCFGQGLDHADLPEVQQADNDYAVGLLVEKVAASRFASSTLIFVLEDDAQDGPDHVDARRSTGYVIGPYVKQGAVVSTPYNTVSMLRTIEDVLGLEHLNLHDDGVPPMTDVFDLRQASWSYKAVPSRLLRAESNLPLPPATAAELALAPVKPKHSAKWWARATRGFDFKKEDMNDAERFNHVLWRGLMGQRPYPSRAQDTREPALSLR